jgi:hypothetical protein
MNPPPPLVGVKVAILSMAEECMLCENVCFFVHFWSVVSAWLIIVLINNQILLKMLGAKNSQIWWNYSLKKCPNYTNSSHQWRPNGYIILICTLKMLPNM